MISGDTKTPGIITPSLLTTCCVVVRISDFGIILWIMHSCLLDTRSVNYFNSEASEARKEL